ncbi:MAG: YopX protein [Bacteriophage sp.]|nr:MAG: YopX protein [Bacteriophage sp.]
MREILFKGKRIDNGEWIEGYYQKKYDFLGKSHLILYVDNHVRWECVEIDPETLCQFTGETDKNGKRIWESDVVWLVYDGKEHIYQIVWDNSELDFKATNGEENYGSNFEYLLCCDEIEVIGNIFDNPELLQEEHK